MKILQSLRSIKTSIFLGCGAIILAVTFQMSYHNNVPAIPLTPNAPTEAVDENSITNQAFREYTNELFTSELSFSTLSLYYTLSDPGNFDLDNAKATFGTFDSNNSELVMNLKSQLAILSTFNGDELSLENKVTYDLLLEYFALSIDGSIFDLYYEPLTPYTGLQSQLPILLAEFPIRDRSSAQIYLNLLGDMEHYFTSLADYELRKSEAGLFMSDTQLDAVIADCKGFLEMPDNYLLSSFENRLSNIEGLTASEYDSFVLDNTILVTESVIKAYADLISSLELLRGTGTNDLGLCYYESGRNYYGYLLKSNVGTTRSVAEVGTLIKSQMEADLEDLQLALLSEEQEPSTFFHDYSTPEEMVSFLEESIVNTFPESADIVCELKDVPTEMEPYLSPAFYLMPTIDAKEVNTIYLNNAHMTDDLTLYTTLAHEGYPGHLYQTTYYQATDPDPVRSILHYGGYLEGWATYAEMCSYYLTDLPDAKIEQKNASLMLGLYAYTDIGIHSEGWGLADTIKFYSTYGITDTDAITRIYNLVLATPTNYLKYYVGYLEMLELKKDCISAWGDEFSQSRFHKAILDVGPCSFQVLRNYVLD